MQKTCLAMAVLSVLSTTALSAEATPPDTSPATQPAPIQQTQPDTTTPPPSPPSTPASAESTPSIPDMIDCNYALPAQTDKVDEKLVSKWATKAAEQAFTFDFSQIDTQLDQLKKCFTPQGWDGFQDAFKKSGNLSAIKSQQLNVSAMSDSAPTITQEKDKTNEWKVSFPMRVVYQNKQQKLTQELTVDILVGRKLTGDLGIMQIVAAPKTTPAATPAQTVTPTSAPAPVTTTTTPSAAPNTSAPTASTPPTQSMPAPDTNKETTTPSSVN